MRYFVIGEEDTVLGFSLVGVSGIQVTNETQARKAWEKALSDKENGIIIITEPVANMIRDIVDQYLFAEIFPLVVVISGPDGQKGKDLRTMVNEAIGVSL